MRPAHPAPSPAPPRPEAQREVGRSPERRSPVFELENALDEYLSHLRIERGASPRTAEAYRRDLEDYLAFLGRRGRGGLRRHRPARRWPPSSAASWSRTSPSPPCAGASPPCAATTGSSCARGSRTRTRPTPWTSPRPPTGCRTCFPSRKWARCWTPSWASAERLARPGAFGSALRLRAARQRGRGARYGGRQLRRRLPARVRQGIQGAHRAHCRRGPSARCAGI